MFKFLAPPPPITPLPKDKIDPTYKQLRFRVFAGIFIGYAGYYLVRNNLSLAKPYLIEEGFSYADLGNAGMYFAMAYGLSKFLMGNVSDRSNSRYFMSIGLILSSLVMFSLGWLPITTASVFGIAIMLFLNGWFQGMGWPPSGRTMVHWFSIKERGTKMAIWNVAHNVGGGFMPLLAILGVSLFMNDWHALFYFPAIVAISIAVFIFLTLRNSPPSQGLPVIEEWKKDFPSNYDSTAERTFSAKEIFIKYILPNKMLWSIALANAFVYLIRYGISDWAPTYLQQVKNFDFESRGWAYSAYEFAGIPGTFLCGWMSDKLFSGRRAPVTIIYMVLIAIAIVIFWMNGAGNPWIDVACLIAIGFLIYGPVMLIGVHALDLVPKNAAGTSAGFTGLFGYFLGTALLANTAAGYIIQHFHWTGFFTLMLAGCLLSIFFIGLTWHKE